VFSGGRCGHVHNQQVARLRGDARRRAVSHLLIVGEEEVRRACRARALAGQSLQGANQHGDASLVVQVARFHVAGVRHLNVRIQGDKITDADTERRRLFPRGGPRVDAHLQRLVVALALAHL